MLPGVHSSRIRRHREPTPGASTISSRTPECNEPTPSYVTCSEEASQQILWDSLTSEGISCQEQAHSIFIPSPGAAAISQVPYQQPVTDMLNLRAFGTSVAESPTVLPHSPQLTERTCPRPHHQVCHSRATLPARQGKTKSRPHKLQKHLAPTSPTEVCTGAPGPPGLLQRLSRGLGSGKCPPVKPAAAGL